MIGIFPSLYDLRGGPISEDPLTEEGNLSGSVPLHDITFSEAESGIVDYYCFYFYYKKPSPGVPSVVTFSVSIFPYVTHYFNFDSGKNRGKIEVGLGTSGINGIEQVIPNRFTAPNGVVFSNSVNITLALYQHQAVWIRRIIHPKYVAYSSGVSVEFGDVHDELL